MGLTDTKGTVTVRRRYSESVDILDVRHYPEALPV